MVAVTHDHNTIDKVVTGLRTIGLSQELATDAINAMHNEGILFRERAPEGQGQEEVPSQADQDLDEKPEEDGNLVAHARRELELIGEEPSTVKGYLQIIRAFANMGHSGGSASVAIPTINALLQFQNLTELTDNPNEWVQHDSEMWPPNGIWQSSRNPEAFSEDEGKTYYLLNEVKKGRPKRFHDTKKIA